MEKVLVTGGAGFIGSHTIDLLLQEGYQVRILDNLTPPVHIHEQIPDYVPINDVEFIRGDVRKKTDWEYALNGVDAVIHLAAYQDYLPDFSKFFHVNTVGTALCYEVIVEKQLPVQKVVVASSQATYGEAKYYCTNTNCSLNGTCPLKHGETIQIKYPPLRDESQLRRGEWNVSCPLYGEVLSWQPVDEAITNPHNQYAMSKYTQEMVSHNLGRRYGIPTVCMRYSIVQGSRQSFRNAYSGVLRIFTQRLLNAEPPVCYEDGQQLRDYVSVHDVARANLTVLQDERADFQVFNVGGDRNVSVLDYARLIGQRANVDIEPQVPGLYRFGDTRHVVSDVSKLKSLGWAPEVSLEDIVDEYLIWAQEQPGFRDYYAEAEEHMKILGTLRQVEYSG
jgi:dTDP-L-rhamnose 4-epimerase